METEQSRSPYVQMDLLGFIYAIWKNRRRFISTVVGITLLSLVVALVWPKRYVSEATIIVRNSSAPTFGGLLDRIIPGSVGNAQLNSEDALTILNSRSLAESIINKFELYEVYNADVFEAAYLAFRSNYTVSDNREGGLGFNPIISLSVEFEDEEPARCKAVVDFALGYVDSVMLGFNKGFAERQLEPINERYLKNLEDLEEAESRLRAFQERYGIVVLEEQTQIFFENLASLKAQIVQKEIELDFIAKSLGTDNSYFDTERQKLLSMENNYSTLITKTPGEVEFLNYTASDLPELGTQYVRLFRAFQTMQAVYELLYPMLEQQKLAISTVTSGVELIDSPRLPTYKSKPKRAFIVLGGFLVSVFFALVNLLAREYYLHFQTHHPNRAIQIEEILRGLRLDWFVK